MNLFPRNKDIGGKEYTNPEQVEVNTKIIRSLIFVGILMSLTISQPQKVYAPSCQDPLYGLNERLHTPNNSLFLGACIHQDKHIAVTNHAQ